MERSNRSAQDEQGFRAVRSLSLVVIFTYGSFRLIDSNFYPPYGNPLLYTIAISWLIALVIAVATSGIFSSASPRLFSLAGWEKDGEIYDRWSIRVFRWVLLHSPLGWINPNLRLSAGGADCNRLLKEMNAAEGVHWLAFLASVTLAILYLAGDHAAYGYSLALVNVPFNVYPIVLQRRNRGRICRMLRRRRLRTPG